MSDLIWPKLSSPACWPVARQSRSSCCRREWQRSVRRLRSDRAGGAANQQHVERRLAAILAADVAGYSRLMTADEEGTHFRLLSHRHEVIEPKVREHRGRIVKHTGDGALAEFTSVVDAVRCALEVQKLMLAAMPRCRKAAASSSAWGSILAT